MSSAVNFVNHVKTLNETMSGMQRILYVGTDYDISKYPGMARKPWRCIYTANQSTDFANAFTIESGRQVRVISAKATYDAASTKLDQNNPMVIYLNGAPATCNGQEDIGVQIARNIERVALRETLTKILKSGLMVELVMVGYDPNNANEISPSELANIVSCLSENRVTIYGLSEERESNSYLHYLEEQNLITVFHQELGQEWEKLLSAQRETVENDCSEEPLRREELQNCVYIEGVPTKLEPKLCRDFNRHGRVLSLQEMETFPISRMMQADYFYRFLKHSPNTPQWYGYAKRNGFAVKREYEDELYQSVLTGLESSSDVPIALAGQTSSGKSIALAALAYRMFQERKYPILFINNPNINLEINSPTGHALDNLLKDIRDKGGRALVIMDLSIYNLQRTDIVRKVSDQYNNRGHRVLFVTSTMYADHIEKRYRVIQAPIKLSVSEKKAFKMLMVEKGKLQRNRVEHWMEKHQEEHGLLSMLYRLLYDLRPQLEHGMKQELGEALEDTRKKLDVLEAPIQEAPPMTALAMKLIAAGYAPTPEQKPEELQQKKKTIMDSLRPFSESLAVATLFKLRVPMTMAMKLLNIPDCKNRQKYRDTVFQAPWLYCAMDDDKYAPGEYCASFRDPMDARIYLNSINLDESAQMGVVARIINAIHNERDSYFAEEIRFLERLIRMIGPNSDDPTVRDSWKTTYGPGCPMIIDALKNLREDGVVEPQLVVQEITYIREYYGQVFDGDLMQQIKCLENATQIARDVLHTADRNEGDTTYWQQGILDSITVESINTEIRLENRYKQAKAQGVEIPDEDKSVLYDYAQRSEMLMRIIESQPENSYPYSALLSSFLTQYQKKTLNGGKYDEMLADMSDVLAVVDATESGIPAVEQNQHYQKYKNLFLEFFDGIYCDANRTDKYFEKLLSIGSAVGVHMKARAILRHAKVDYNKMLTGEWQRTVCKNALEVLENPDYERVVRNHAACQYLRLQLTWLIRNEQPIFTRERQTTCMSESDWQSLRQICQKFKDNIVEKQISCHYVATVYYIYALACAQLGEYENAINVWKEVHEEDIYTSNRQRTWHILSGEDGTPKVFNGTFNILGGLPERRIYIREMQRPVLYYSLQNINMSDTSGDAPNLLIGTSYRGFSAFAKKKELGGTV